MSNYKELPSQEYLRECFDYDYDTGVLTWKARPLSHFKDERAMKISNTKKAGGTAGSIAVKGYRIVGIDFATYMAHRLIHRLVTGKDPGPKLVDHINHDRDDNRWSNLRIVDGMPVNGRNMTLSTSNTSGVTGVRFHKPTQKWQARIRVDGKEINLLLTDCFDAAVAARKAAEREYGFHPNHGASKAA